MKKVTHLDIISTGLAIFSMLFGAGNLMYPIEVGMKSGSNIIFGMIGFLLTAVLLPIVGLVGIILFDGDYNAYFNRIGTTAGQCVIYVCMIIIGPLIAIPRIVTLSHTMIGPMIPIAYLQQSHWGSALIFSIIFLGITFFTTYKENRIVDILGYVVSPLLLFSLAGIVAKGIWSANDIIASTSSPADVFKHNIVVGYETLDLLGAIFFASIILNILKNNFGQTIKDNPRYLASISTKAGIIGVSLLGLVYVGLSFLGAFFGHGLQATNPDVLFRAISFKVVGTYGAALIATAVLMACFSTAIALAAVLSEYLQKTILKNKISFQTALICVLASCIPLSVAGLSVVRHLVAGPLLYVGYPVLITIAFCNIAYKLVGFKPIKMPVLITFIVAITSYLW